ncbi:hypothetical protein [Pectobacterium parvum]|uniref:hypothetical protein n=1 Tax=Pectobacterium parvum TaxID=2778550 RepID=UPI001FD8F0F8|nr:hypothetical protein [Pectobacterium parvum]
MKAGDAVTVTVGTETTRPPSIPMARLECQCSGSVLATNGDVSATVTTRDTAAMSPRNTSHATGRYGCACGVDLYRQCHQR